jgi:hypothetical protein
MSHPRSLAGPLALPLVLGAAVASITLAANSGATFRVTPARTRQGGLAPIFRRTFANPGGAAQSSSPSTPDGRTVMNVGGIAPWRL